VMVRGGVPRHENRRRVTEEVNDVPVP